MSLFQYWHHFLIFLDYIYLWGRGIEHACAKACMWREEEILKESVLSLCCVCPWESNLAHQVNNRLGGKCLYSRRVLPTLTLASSVGHYSKFLLISRTGAFLPVLALRCWCRAGVHTLICLPAFLPSTVVSSFMSELSPVRAELLGFLTHALLGDSLAAEYLILHLISTV